MRCDLAQSSCMQGWMIKIKPLNAADVDKLLDSIAYSKETENKH